MKYKVIREDSLDTLMVIVNEHIKNGWEPLGGIAVVAYTMSGTIYLQALIIR